MRRKLPTYRPNHPFHKVLMLVCLSGWLGCGEPLEPTLPTVDLTGVWGTSSSDLFAVGSGGTVLHYDGSAWSDMF